MLTAPKLEANRANAQHSTGPRTPEGKAKVSRNPVKHGLTSKDVILRSDEDREEFTELREDLPNQVIGRAECCVIEGVKGSQDQQVQSETDAFHRGEPPEDADAVEISEDERHGRGSRQGNPTKDDMRPSPPAIRPLKGERPDRMAMNTIPVNTITKDSGDAKAITKGRNIGIIKISTATPKIPPTAEAQKAIPHARAPCPFRVIGKPSKRVAALLVSPGTFSKMPVSDPPALPEQ